MKRLIAGFIELTTIEGQVVQVRHDAIDLIAKRDDGTGEIVVAGSRVQVRDTKGLLDIIEQCQNHQQRRDIQAAEIAAVRSKGPPLVSR